MAKTTRRIVLAELAGDNLGLRISTRFDWTNALRREDRPKAKMVVDYLQQSGISDVWLFGDFNIEVLFRIGSTMNGCYDQVSFLATGKQEPVSAVVRELRSAISRRNPCPFDKYGVRFDIRNVTTTGIFEPNEAARFNIGCKSNCSASLIDLYLIEKGLLMGKYVKR